MGDRFNYLLPVAVGAAGLSIYAYFEYRTWIKQRKSKNTEGDGVSHRLMLNKAYASVVIAQVELIASTTDTEIEVDKRFSEDDVIFSLLMKGSRENVQEAESYINRIIEAAPEMTSAVLEIPKEKVMVIVGNFGSKLLSLSQETGCKVFLKCDPEFYEVSPFYIEIQGPTTQTLFAYNLVRNMLVKEPVPSHSSELEHLPKEFPLDVINETNETNYIGVIISYISTISNFWIQLYRLSSTLDKMERRLFEHFSSSEVVQKEVVEPKVGLFIAVPYTKQGKWHRAKIVSVIKGSQPSDPCVVKAQFVDYGDTDEVNINEVKIIPEEFLQYPYFAVECCLGGIASTTLNSKGESEWSEEALDLFEALVFKSHKILMACKTGEVHIQGNGYNDVIKRIIPSINLVDTNAVEDKVIAAELVERGYALWTKEVDDTIEDIKDVGVRLVLDDGSDTDFDNLDDLYMILWISHVCNFTFNGLYFYQFLQHVPHKMIVLLALDHHSGTYQQVKGGWLHFLAL